jgi:hypothetical protein
MARRIALKEARKDEGARAKQKAGQGVTGAAAPARSSTGVGDLKVNLSIRIGESKLADSGAHTHSARRDTARGEGMGSARYLSDIKGHGGSSRAPMLSARSRGSTFGGGSEGMLTARSNRSARDVSDVDHLLHALALTDDVVGFLLAGERHYDIRTDQAPGVSAGYGNDDDDDDDDNYGGGDDDDDEAHDTLDGGSAGSNAKPKQSADGTAASQRSKHAKNKAGTAGDESNTQHRVSELIGLALLAGVQQADISQCIERSELEVLLADRLLVLHRAASQSGPYLRAKVAAETVKKMKKEHEQRTKAAQGIQRFVRSMLEYREGQDMMMNRRREVSLQDLGDDETVVTLLEKVRSPFPHPRRALTGSLHARARLPLARITVVCKIPAHIHGNVPVWVAAAQYCTR